MRIALVDSGIGLLSTAVELRRLRPDADLVVSMDPDHMPWGSRTAQEIVGRALAGARAAQSVGPIDAIAVPCNTASVYALAELRAEFEPDVPVIGTVPPVKPAAEHGGPIAVWSTPATARSGYLRDLITRFADPARVTPVGCTGLAEAIESAQPAAVSAAVRAAAMRTPGDVSAVVLGCTHYDLVDAEISAALRSRPALFTAAVAVAAQTLRRVAGAGPGADGAGTLTVLAGGVPVPLPARATTYAPGAQLAAAPPVRS